MRTIMADVTVLDILLYGEPIGALTRVSGDRTIFAFNEDYIADENRPVLGLNFKDQLGALITEFKPTQTKVMPFFSNLLPEGHMRTYLAERAGVNPARDFFLLWVLGSDLPGAITIRPADGEAWPPDAHDADDDDRHESSLRFSLAGVQLKFSAIHEARGGLTIPAKGVGGSWIIKLPSREFAGVPENEYSMMTLARLIGMDVPALHLVDVDAIRNLPDGIGALEGQALAIQRFDRLEDGSAVHIEDLAQVFGVYPLEKYKKASARNIAAVIGIESGDDDVAEFIRRLTFNTLIGNTDMHLKNWSLIYPDRRHAALAPAYDFVATIPYIPDSKAALNFSRTRRFDEFTENELSHLAAKALLPEKLVLDTARETVALFHQHWHAEKANLPLTAEVIKAVEAHLKTIPIA
jgi:serine/threonine-protein kinase HipA